MGRVIFLLLALASCGITPPVVVPNTQVGKTNNQTIGRTDARVVEQTVRQAETVRQSSDQNQNQVRTERIEHVIQDNRSNSPWLIWAFAAALLLDSPLRWPGQIYGALRGRRD